MSEHQTTHLFGPFRLDPQDQTLLQDGEPVPLSPKGWQILWYLIQRPGELVSKEELLREIWPDQIVEEGSLFQQVSHLRRTLGDNPRSPTYILTIPGKGYLFNHPVTLEVQEFPPVANPGREHPAPAISAPGLSKESRGFRSIANGSDWFKSDLSRRWVAGGLAVGGLLGTILLWIAFSARQPPPSATEPVPTLLPLV
ncbi:MAG: winged helix-turn-helix domain-containing protein, partial [Blastocatellia bacterium]